MKPHYLDRLSVLANYLVKNSDNIKYQDPLPIHFEGYNESEGVYVVFYFYQWVFQDMPYLFRYWKIENNRPIHELAKEGNSTVWSVIMFFGFLENIDSFLHLFTVGFQQPSVYGGVFLDKEANASDLAYNIIQFISKYKTDENTQNL